MSRISPTDHVLLLLRDRLERAQRRPEKASPQSASPRERVEAMAALRTLDERSFRKTLVRGLLAHKVGEILAGDPAFEDVVQAVLATLEDSPAGVELLAQAERLLGRSAV